MRFRIAVLSCVLVVTPLAALADESAPCRFTGGGCLNIQPGTKLEATFGGNVGSLHGPWQGTQGPTSDTWEHVFRDGRTILFTLHSSDAHVVRCRFDGSGPCPPPDGATRVEFEGTANFGIGAAASDEAGNFEASIVDVGTCAPGTGDSYSIRVRRGSVVGVGEIVYEVSGQISCGNFQARAPWQNSGR